MTSTASTILRLELMGDGDQPGNWGDTTNTNLGTLLEGSIAGVSNVSVTSAAQALSAVNYATDQSRMAILILTTTTAANFAVYAPGNNTLTPSPISKTYAIYNNTSYTATIYNSTVTGNTTAAGAGVDLAAGEKAYVFSDGVNFYKAVPSTLSLSLGTAAAPSLSFIGDANTGIYSAGAEQLNITSNGVRTAAFNSGTFDVYAINSVSSISARNIYTNAAGSFFNFYKANNGGSGAEAIVANSDTLGTVRFFGYDGSTYRSGAEISAVVDGTPGASDMPGRLTFSTTADGASSVTERVRITNAGYVGVNNTAPVTQLDVAGPAGVTSFTGATRLGVTVRGATGITDYSGIDFIGSSTANPTARIGVISATGGSSFVIGTSNNYTSGITNTALTINQVGNATFVGAVSAGGSIAATGALSTQGSLTVGGAGATASISGSAPLYMCRAWVTFSASGGSITVNGSGNVSSVTYNSSGDYTINFSTAMPTANYAVSGVCASWNGGQGLNVSVKYGSGGAFGTTTPTLKSTSQLQIVVGVGNSASGIDGPEVNVMIFC